LAPIASITRIGRGCKPQISLDKGFYRKSGILDDMDISKLITGLIIIVLGALMMADGVLGFGWLGYEGPSLFSIPALKLMVGFIAIVLAAYLFGQSRK